MIITTTSYTLFEYTVIQDDTQWHFYDKWSMKKSLILPDFDQQLNDMMIFRNISLKWKQHISRW